MLMSWLLLVCGPSDKFGHTFANSGNQDETAPYESSHQHFYYLLS